MKTPNETPLVSCIVVGVMKSGTTALSNLLHQHPNIAIPRPELGFFNAHYQKGIEWYHGLFDKEINEQTQLVAEKTPYSYIPETAERIARYNPKMKLVWVFRDPVERAISNYYHDLTNLEEWRSFDSCVKQESNRELYFQYLSKGRYTEQIENFLQHFPKEQMHFLLFKDLIHNTTEVMRDLFRFLEVPEEAADGLELERKKASIIPRYRPVVPYFYKKWFKPAGPIWNQVWKMHFSGDNKKKVTPEMKEELYRYYRDEYGEFERITGLSTHTWKHYEAD